MTSDRPEDKWWIEQAEREAEEAVTKAMEGVNLSFPDPVPRPETVEVPRAVLLDLQCFLFDDDGTPISPEELRQAVKDLLAARPHAASPAAPDAGGVPLSYDGLVHDNTALRSELASLRAQLAEAVKQLETYAVLAEDYGIVLRTSNQRIDELQAALAEKDKRIGELEAGLTPFSDAAEEHLSDGERFPDHHELHWSGTTVGDLRRARAILSVAEKGSG